MVRPCLSQLWAQSLGWVEGQGSGIIYVFSFLSIAGPLLGSLCVSTQLRQEWPWLLLWESKCGNPLDKSSGAHIHRHTVHQEKLANQSYEYQHGSISRYNVEWRTNDTMDNIWHHLNVFCSWTPCIHMCRFFKKIKLHLRALLNFSFSPSFIEIQGWAK